jgi:hypothetical protein
MARVSGATLLALAAVVLLGARAALQCFAQPKKPMSSYMLWMNENRAKIVKKVGTTDVAVVGKEAGAQWNKLASRSKTKYVKQAAKAQTQYEKDMKKFLDAGGVVAPRRVKKPVRDPNMPRSPGSPYSIFVSEKHASIVKKLKQADKTNIAAVGKAMGAAWAKATAKTKGTYEKKYAKVRAEYEKAMGEYKASLEWAEYQKKMKKYKEYQAALAEA